LNSTITYNYNTVTLIFKSDQYLFIQLFQKPLFID